MTLNIRMVSHYAECRVLFISMLRSIWITQILEDFWRILYVSHSFNCQLSCKTTNIIFLEKHLLLIQKGFSIISKTRRSICTKWHLCGAPFSDPTLEEDFLLAFLTLSVLKCLAVTIYVAYYKLIYLATINWFMYSPWPFSLLHSGCFQQDSTYDTATIIQGPMI